jgi:hypothetical protein
MKRTKTRSLLLLLGSLICLLVLASTSPTVPASTVEGSGGAISETVFRLTDTKTFVPSGATLKDGDSIKICNESPVFHHPFSKSPYNRFGNPDVGRIVLRRGECMTQVMKNPTNRSIEVHVFCEIHTSEQMTLTVRPTTVKRNCDPAIFNRIRGTWQSNFGPVTLQGSCDKVTGSWQQDVNAKGEITGGSFDSDTRKLTISYKQSWNNVTDGRAVFTLTADGKLDGTYSGGGGNGIWIMHK